ncbi:hypothetical protein BJ944DRAFT_166806, partial [Cunninghamella echinulata]
DYAEERQMELEALESIYPDEYERGLSLHITYTPNYPDELPEFEIDVIEGDISKSLGMAMIFTMASLLKEALNEMVMGVQRIREEAEEERKRKIEEVENAKFHGTQVTIERFLAWKKAFDKEMEALEDQVKLARAKELKNKLTGRQLFEQDKSLALSDAKYMEEGDVSVDASQYEKEQPVAVEEDDKEAVWKSFGDDE